MALMIEGKDLTGQAAKMTVEQSVMQALILKAQSGDVPAIKEAQDTLYGKTPDKTELTGKDGEEFKGMTVTFAKPNDPA